MFHLIQDFQYIFFYKTTPLVLLSKKEKKKVSTNMQLIYTKKTAFLSVDSFPFFKDFLKVIR